MTQLSSSVGWYYGSKDGLYYKYYNFENGSYVSWETKYVSLNLFLFIYIFKSTFSIFYFFLLCFRLSVTFNFQADKSNANKGIVIVGDDSVHEISYQNAPSHTNTNDVMFEDARFEGFVVNEATVRWGDVATFSQWRGKSINLQNIFFIKNKKWKYVAISWLFMNMWCFLDHLLTFRSYMTLLDRLHQMSNNRRYLKRKMFYYI